MNRLRAVPSLLVVLAGLAFVGTSAAPARAAYLYPSYSWFSGADKAGNTVTFHVGHGQFGRAIDKAVFTPADFDGELRRHSDFPEEPIVGGRFTSCTNEKVTEVFSRRYCIYGQFEKADEASGHVLVFLIAGGQAWRNPLGFFRWDADTTTPAPIDKDGA
jgi:hypothetical protein